MTWTLVTRYAIIYSKIDTDRVYVSRKRGAKGLIGCEHIIREKESNIVSNVESVTGEILLEIRKSGMEKMVKQYDILLVKARL